jgi:hypothetical protein
MALPKKIKKTLDLSPEKTGYGRRVELLDDINRDGTYLPKSLLHEDLDKGFLDFVKNDLKTITDGKVIPVVDILITTQNWAQFAKTWNFSNLDKNVEPPVITTVRTPEVKFGSTPSLKYNIPNRKQYYYAAVPNWNDGRKGYDVYTIPQPVPVDIKYSVKIICNRMRELNSLNKKIIEKFASRQAYTQIKGHYIPIVLDEISDESVMEMEKRKFYIQSYNFTLMGFLIDENEFEVKPGISRALTLIETRPNRIKNKRPKDYTKNSDLIKSTVNFPISVTSYTQTYEYTADISQEGIININSYDVYINNLYYGTNIFSQTDGKIQLNTNDVLKIEITKTDITKDSTIKLISRLL